MTDDNTFLEQECEHMVQAIEFELKNLQRKANETIGNSLPLSQYKREMIVLRINTAVSLFAFDIVFPDAKKKKK